MQIKRLCRNERTKQQKQKTTLLYVWNPIHKHIELLTTRLFINTIWN